MEITYNDEAIRTLWRGAGGNYSTCEAACSGFKDQLPDTWTVRYFRCFTFEMGNRDDVTDKGESGEDVVCRGMITSNSVLFNSIQLIND